MFENLLSVKNVTQSIIAQDRALLVVIDDLTDIVKVSKIKTWQKAARQVAHEIKNPLTPIQLATQRLQRKFKSVLGSDPAFLNCTNTILNQVSTIKDLVTHFSHFSSMPSSKIELVDLVNLVQEVLSLYQISYPEILFDFNSFLARKTLIRTDKEKIRLVLVNLLDNSVRALNQKLKLKRTNGAVKVRDQMTVKIDVSFDYSKKLFNLIFSDNGPGIPQTVKDTLFLPYVSTEKKNMGLGLAIVHDIVVQLGGTIKLVSITHGATFLISLPSKS